MSARVLWAPRAWIQGRWEANVCLSVNAQGHWADITPNIPCLLYTSPSPRD